MITYKMKLTFNLKTKLFKLLMFFVEETENVQIFKIQFSGCYKLQVFQYTFEYFYFYMKNTFAS